MADLLIKNACILDVDAGTVSPRTDLRIDAGRIAEIGDGLTAPDLPVIDIDGRTLMPGLIDCHLHICADSMTAHPSMPASYAAARAAKTLRETLMRGYTTARDAGGADAGHRQAVADGLFDGPNLFVAGNPLSQTGGHGDLRGWGEMAPRDAMATASTTMQVVDGVDDMRRAVRETLRRGADQIKILASGGISSPSDPLMGDQFSRNEIAVAVAEARRRGTYVMAHAYAPGSIRRCVETGVRTIEHGNFLDEATAKAMKDAGAYLVPTLVVYKRVVEHAEEIGISAFHLEKAQAVLENGPRSIEIAAHAGVPIAFGTDLFRAPKEHQSEEFLMRAEVQAPADIIRSATSVGAEVLRQADRIGRVKQGFDADLIALDGNPLEDLGLFQNQGQHIPLIVQKGAVKKCTPVLEHAGAEQ